MSIECTHWTQCDNTNGGCCALGRFGGRPSRGTCLLLCDVTWPGKAQAAAAPVQPIAEVDRYDRSLWPMAARLGAMAAAAGDAGLGDTIDRIIGPVGGDWWKAKYVEITGEECGCPNRQAKLNWRFPYRR